MDYACFVCGGERIANLFSDFENLWLVQYCRVQEFTKGDAFDVFHSDVMGSVRFTKLVNVSDVWMGNGRSSTRLLLKAQHAHAIVSYGCGKEFECDFAIKGRIVGQIHVAHATVAQHVGDLIARDSISDQRHTVGPQDLQRQRHVRLFHEAVLTIRGREEFKNLAFKTFVSLALLLE